MSGTVDAVKEYHAPAACIDTGSGAVRIAINQVEYSNTAQGPVIHIFGRDESGCAVHLEVTGFRPYFYAPVGEADQNNLPPTVEVERGSVYRSIRGEPLRRLYTPRPTDVRDVRERFQHYEADIPFATRFMIDCGLTGGVEAPALTVDYREITPADVEAPARVCMLDIECDDSRGFPEAENDSILCITCWDSFENAYATFLFQPPGGSSDLPSLGRGATLPDGCFCEEKHAIRCYATEHAMLKGFVEHIRAVDPDILSGWNIEEFDIPYLLRRMEVLGLSPTLLARLPGQTERNALRGRAIFDLLQGYKKIHGATQKESYRLDAIAEAELGETKVRYNGTVSDLWRTDLRRLIEYNFTDVALCVAIDRENLIIEFYREIARYVGCPLDRTINSSSVIDVYVLRKAHGRFVLPSKGFAAGDEFEGATVFDPTLGIRENVVVLDLKSLYPMAMMTINASPETKDPEGEYRAPNGVRFRREPDGLTRSILAELLEEREERKRLRNQHPFGSRQYLLYDLQQNVIKVIMNSYYGVSGYARFRLYDREIGSAITSVGRAIIEHTRRVIEEMGYHVLYGDTDSCMVELPPSDIGTTIRTAREIEAALNASYADFARNTLNAEKHYFSIKFEKIYRRFFQAGKKKRYGGHLIWKEGREVDEIDVVGFEIRRSDSPQITRIVQKKVFDMLLRGEGFEAVRAYLSGIIRKYRAGKFTLDEIGIPGGIGKQLDQYETNDAHIRGAKYANQHLGAQFGRGSKPKRVYIKHVRARYPQTDVIAFEYGDQVPPEFVVDYETMLDKTIKQPISRIIEAVGWSWDDVDPTRTTLAQFGL
ncbi:MAG: DNA-directed DNA polymerase [Methanomicrobiales archaeon]|nr:DNA-directed DNA polymerase [Methanomicrobiales archaeon]